MMHQYKHTIIPLYHILGAIILPSNSYRYTRSVYISDLNCTGDERSTQNCSYTSPRSGSCSNAAIICQREFDFNGAFIETLLRCTYKALPLFCRY